MACKPPYRLPCTPPPPSDTVASSPLGVSRQAMQCAAIPYRRTPADELEVLLVTSRGKGNWILPKGKVKPGKSAAVSAQEEVYEEAGAKGTLDQALILQCDIPWPDGDAATANEQMQIFSLEVENLMPVWPEMFQRKRSWVSLAQAVEAVKGAHYRAALERFASLMAPIG